jgi:hypothetical protein
MTAGHVSRHVGTTGPRQEVRDLSSLNRLDYADVFTLLTTTEATPEEWARAMFGNTPNIAERLIWCGILGMRLLPSPAPEVVASWRIGGCGSNWLRLENGSGFMASNLVVHLGSGDVSLGTFAHYRRPRGRVVWNSLSPIHRRLAPGLLLGAEALVRRQPPRGRRERSRQSPEHVPPALDPAHGDTFGHQAEGPLLPRE